MAQFHIHRLVKSTDPERREELIRQQHPPLMAVRLKTLKENPSAFLSKYEDEVDMPLDKWLNRLRPAEVQHFVAVASGVPANEDFHVSEDSVFVGYLVVLDEWRGKLHDEGTIPTYHLAAFAVEPEYQGKGIGTHIIEAALDWAREDAKSAGLRKIRFRLAWMTGNERVASIYERSGFISDNELSAEEKECDTENAMSLLVDLELCGKA